MKKIVVCFIDKTNEKWQKKYPSAILKRTTNFSELDLINFLDTEKVIIENEEKLTNSLEKKDVVILKKVVDLKKVFKKLNTKTTILVSLSLEKETILLKVYDSNVILKDGKDVDLFYTLLYLKDNVIASDIMGKNIAIKKRQTKISKRKIFLFISVLIFLLSLIVYSIRLIHFYKLEHKKVINEDKVLSEVIIENSDNLKENDKDYIFKGNVDNNYLYYSNQLWRIIKIDSKKNIEIISEDTVSSLVYSYESNDFDTSYVYKWLNNKYYNILNNPDKYIKDTAWCSAKGKSKKENCKSKITSKIGLITYSDYVMVGANNSYINTGKYFWTMTPSDNERIWYVFDKGGINDESYSGNNYHGYGIRPVMTLKNDVPYLSGSGTKEDPYRFVEDAELAVGSFIKYSDYIFRVVNKDEETLTLALADNLKESEEDITYAFSKRVSDFRKNDYGSLYNYLNNNFYNALDKTLIVDGKWYTGSYSDSYDYENIYSDEIIAKVGLLNIADIFTCNNKDYYTLSPYDDESVNSISNSCMIEKAEITEVKQIRPAIQITSQIKVLSGNGTQEDPYQVGV